MRVRNSSNISTRQPWSCNIAFTSKFNADQHYQGLNHARTSRKRKSDAEPGQLAAKQLKTETCDICNVNFNLKGNLNLDSIPTILLADFVL